MNAFITACIKANQEIYEYIHTHIVLNDYNYSNTIGAGGDNSLHIDIICENIFIKHLIKFGSINTEEQGFIESERCSKIIIDPLDGSHNFQSGLPYYGTSVCLEKDNVAQYSMVCNLANHTLVYKEHGQGVISLDLISLKPLNERCDTMSELSIFERAYAYPDICQKLFDNGIKYRSCGAVALSLADAKYYDFVLFAGALRVFDIQAALHICEGLFIHKSDKFLIVTKNKDTYTLIKEIIKE